MKEVSAVAVLDSTEAAIFNEAIRDHMGLSLPALYGQMLGPEETEAEDELAPILSPHGVAARSCSVRLNQDDFADIWIVKKRFKKYNWPVRAAALLEMRVI